MSCIEKAKESSPSVAAMALMNPDQGGHAGRVRLRGRESVGGSASLVSRRLQAPSRKGAEGATRRETGALNRNPTGHSRGCATILQSVNREALNRSMGSIRADGRHRRAPHSLAADKREAPATHRVAGALERWLLG